MSSVADVAIPLVTGLVGLLVGAGFSRVTSRNDQRRQRYAEALSAFEGLIAAADEDAEAVEQARVRVDDVGHWLELDSVPVSNAFKLLIQAQQAHTRPTTDQRVAEAREAFIDAAHTYSSWRLPQRFWLQARTKRLKGSVVTGPVTPRKG